MDSSLLKELKENILKANKQFGEMTKEIIVGQETYNQILKNAELGKNIVGKNKSMMFGNPIKVEWGLPYGAAKIIKNNGDEDYIQVFEN